MLENRMPGSWYMAIRKESLKISSEIYISVEISQ
jgi:hypothetical protein